MATTPLGDRPLIVNVKESLPIYTNVTDKRICGIIGNYIINEDDNDDESCTKETVHDINAAEELHPLLSEKLQLLRLQQKHINNYEALLFSENVGTDLTASSTSYHFECDDNEWDIGIGNLIIDLDADIEKTRNDKLYTVAGMASSSVAETNPHNQIQHVSDLTSRENNSLSINCIHSIDSSSTSCTTPSPSVVCAASLCDIPSNTNIFKKHFDDNSDIANLSLEEENVQNINLINTANIDVEGNSGKMAIEHSATVDKGLKMKIKRTKSATKTNEAKHEIVKSHESNGIAPSVEGNNSTLPLTSIVPISLQTGHNVDSQNKQITNKSISHNSFLPVSNTNHSLTLLTTKRSSGTHRRDKTRDKHDKLQQSYTQYNKSDINGAPRLTSNNLSPVTSVFSGVTSSTSSVTSIATPLINDVLTMSTSTNTTSCEGTVIGTVSNINQSSSGAQQQYHKSSSCVKIIGFQTGVPTDNSIPCSSPNPTVNVSFVGSITKCENSKTTSTSLTSQIMFAETAHPIEFSNSPPSKKLKLFRNETKDISDACVGTSIGTSTEPDCLGPCEPGTSVTLEGIVWHETEGGVLVVNVTWRGKTYVGTLLDCTRHDWAPPRFCESPTSEFEARIPKGRGKRGRASNPSSGSDLSNFTETRSSVHSKLRNTGTKGRRGVQGSSIVVQSISTFTSPRTESGSKRKSTRCFEDDEKCKRKTTRTPPRESPSASPVLLECPEPNCSKKYKHINGLKYHQSHAHGSAEDDDSKEVISMSENDESNIEVPSPATSIKSPIERAESTLLAADRSSITISHPSSSIQPPSPLPHVASPIVHLSPTLSVKNAINSEMSILEDDLSISDVRLHTSKHLLNSSQSLQSLQMLQSNTPSISPCLSQSSFPVSPNAITPKNESYDIPATLESISIQQSNSPSPQSAMSQTSAQPQISQQSSPFHSVSASHNGIPVLSANCSESFSELQQIPSSIHKNEQCTVSEATLQPTDISCVPDQLMLQTQITTVESTERPAQNVQSHVSSYSNTDSQAQVHQFKVRPTATLMPDQDKQKDSKSSRLPTYKKRVRKSSACSPPRSPLTTSIHEREDVQSPAYSDISDEAAPIIEVDNLGKLVKQGNEKENETNTQTYVSHFNLYPFYGQTPYIPLPSQEKSEQETKTNDFMFKQEKPVSAPQISNLTNLGSISSEKDKSEYASNLPRQSHSFYYGNYPSYISSVNIGESQLRLQPGQQIHDQESQEQKSKLKQELAIDFNEKQQENHQILKESIEMKSQMSPYHSFHSQSQKLPPLSGSLNEERRYYIYSGDQRRNEDLSKQNHQAKYSNSNSKQSHKQEKGLESGKLDESKIKQEGVKPTMETQGPPPPPTSQYAYIHSGYIPPHHYSGLAFETGHPGIYRNLTPMIVSGSYPGSPYIHPLPRYHAPEDLSRPQGGKALDMLQHHANQYYSAHKIHELQERALKSPPMKSTSPSSGTQLSVRPPTDQPSVSISTSLLSQSQQTTNKQAVQAPLQHQTTSRDIGSQNNDVRSPPPQRHVHTHHHTHVGLGYPLLAGQYPPPYGGKPLIRP